MIALARPHELARVLGPFALSLAALAIGSPAHAAGPKATTTTKTAAAPKPKPRPTAAKVHTVLLEKHTGTTKAEAFDGDLSFVPGGTSLPFADMPVPAHARAQGVTADSFPLTPWQLETSHGSATVQGWVITRGNDWGFRLPSRGGVLALFPNASWMAGHDLTMECWGEFGSGAIMVRAGGRNEAGQATLFASAQVSPPPGNRGRFKVSIPTKGMTPLGAFQVRVADADLAGKSLKIYECVMSRD